MADIFGYTRATSPAAVMSNDDSILTIGGVSSKGKLIQGWNVSYRQEIQEVYEIGSSNIYWVRGHPMGQGAVNRIVGGPETGDIKLFSEDAYNVCKGGATLVIAMKPGFCSSGTVGTNVSLTMSGCVVTQIGFSVAIQDIRINQDIQWKFASLEVK